VVIVGVGHDLQASIMAVVLAKEAGAKYVVAKATDDLHAKILKKVGADRIVMPEKDMGVRLAQKLVSNNVLDFIELSKDYSFTDMQCPNKWVGKTRRQLDCAHITARTWSRSAQTATRWIFPPLPTGRFSRETG
jgi:trk system potassium uptake protein TrkA